MLRDKGRNSDANKRVKGTLFIFRPILTITNDGYTRLVQFR